MAALQITMLLNIGSLVFGGCAWLFGFIAMVARKGAESYRSTVASFCFCVTALLFQLFEISNRVDRGDYAAIEDTIRAVLLASVVLIVITAALNIAACIKAKKK